MSLFNKIDNPHANAERAEILSKEVTRFPYPGQGATDLQWKEYWDNQQLLWLKTRALQEQEVIDKRELIEKFAKMIEDYRFAGKALEEFAQKHDIPGVCGYSGFENFVNNDIVEDALQWAASNHSC